MEDDDKVRRNLVVVSFSILLYFWLDLPNGVLVGRILGPEAKVQISEWKVWVLLCVVLVYQVHRFYSVSASSEKWTKTAAAYVQARFHVIRRILQKELHSLSRGIDFEHGFVDERANEQLLKIAEEADSSTARDLNIYHCSYERSAFWQGSFSIQHTTDQLGSFINFDFAVPLPRRWLIDLETSTRLAVSEHASEFAFPVLLAYCALLVAINALVRSLL